MGNIVEMNPIRLLSILAIFNALLGCQKELHEEVPTGDPPVIQKKFVKFSTYSLPDSLVVFQKEYAYDANNKLKSITTTERFQQPNGSIRTQVGLRSFFRDNQGRVIRISTGPDSSIFSMDFNYPSLISLKPQSAVSTRTRGGLTRLIDSVAISYNSTGQVNKTVRFMMLNTGKLETSSYETYTYDALGNLSSKQQYSDSAGNRQFRVVISYTWQYDNKKNPLYFDEIPYFFNDGIFAYTASVNNVLRQVNNYVIFPSDELNFVFEYDSNSLLKVSKSLSDQRLVTLYYYE